MTLETVPPPLEASSRETEEVVLVWRIEQFCRLGFPDRDAGQLARSDADLGVARRLRRARCPVDLALRILG